MFEWLSLTKAVPGIFSLLTKLFSAKAKSMRTSLYLELGRNIEHLKNVSDLRRHSAQTRPYELVNQAITDYRYQAAKKDSETFYKLAEADIFDDYYKQFRAAGDIAKMYPIEFSQQIIGRFFLQLESGSLERKLMKKNASEWLKNEIDLLGPPAKSWVKRLW